MDHPANRFGGMTNPSQQPGKPDDHQGQGLYQPGLDQTDTTYGFEDFDLTLFNTLDTSNEGFWDDVLSGFDELPPDPTSSCDAATTHWQQPTRAPLSMSPSTSYTSTPDSDQPQPQQYPAKHIVNSNMIMSFPAEDSMFQGFPPARQGSHYQRQSTTSTQQSGTQRSTNRKRKFDEPPAAPYAPEATQQQQQHRERKQPRTTSSNSSAITNASVSTADATTSSPDHRHRIPTLPPPPTPPYAIDNNCSRHHIHPGATQANPLVLDADADNGDDSSITREQQHPPCARQQFQQHGIAPTTATLPPDPAKAAAKQNVAAAAAVAFAVQESIPLSDTAIGIGGSGAGHAHRTFAFSPACCVGVRRGGGLVSVKKGERVLHFTSNKGTAVAAGCGGGSHTVTNDGGGGGGGGNGNSNNNGNGSNGNGSSSNGNSNSNNDADNDDGNRNPDQSHRTSGEDVEDVGVEPRLPFKVVGFGPCQRCQEGKMLCDRGFPCRACIGDAGGDAVAAMDQCRLPVVTRPDGAVDGDELLERGDIRVVRPRMAVVEVAME